MRTVRIHVPEPLQADTEMTLPEDAAHHAIGVLRLRPGDRLTLFNGDGLEYRAEIIHADRRRDCRVLLGSAERPGVESGLDVTLVQAVCRGDRMDWCIQKSTELGVGRIQPVFTARTGVRLDRKRAEKRQQHWRQVAVSACEQCGRVRVPEIAAALPLGDLDSAPGQGLFLHPQAVLAAGDLAAPPDAAFRIVIGPEGGLDSDETRHLEQLGYQGLRLGPRILRTETAGPAVLAMLQTRFGDW